MKEFNDYEMRRYFFSNTIRNIVYHGNEEDENRYLNNCKLIEDIVIGEKYEQIVEDLKNAPDWYKCVIKERNSLNNNVTYYNIVDYLAKPYKPVVESYSDYKKGKIKQVYNVETRYIQVARPAIKYGPIQYDTVRKEYGTWTTNEKEIRRQHSSMVQNANNIYERNTNRNINIMKTLFKDLDPSIVKKLVSNTNDVYNTKIKNYFNSLVQVDEMSF